MFITRLWNSTPHYVWLQTGCYYWISFYSLNVVLEIKVALWQCEKIDVNQLQCHITFCLCNLPAISKHVWKYELAQQALWSNWLSQRSQTGVLLLMDPCHSVTQFTGFTSSLPDYVFYESSMTHQFMGLVLMLYSAQWFPFCLGSIAPRATLIPYLSSLSSAGTSVCVVAQWNGAGKMSSANHLAKCNKKSGFSCILCFGMVQCTDVCHDEAQGRRRRVCGCSKWYCCQEVTPEEVPVAQFLFMRFCGICHEACPRVSTSAGLCISCPPGPTHSPASLWYLQRAHSKA